MVTLKDRVASSLGCMLEWYDFALYGFFAPVLASVFFATGSELHALLKAFSIFAVGFIARPFGALLFGTLSDKYGRLFCLKLTPLWISLPTLGIALLPSYQHIGIIAPALLIFFRLIQGLVMGGEFSNTLIYLCETSSLKRRYFWGSIGASTGCLGIFLASSVAAFFYNYSLDFLASAGWRIAFGSTALIGVSAYFLRLQLAESNTYMELIRRGERLALPLLSALKYQKKDFLRSIGLTFLPATVFYYIFFFMPSFASQILGLESKTTLEDNSIFLLSRLCLMPLIGLIADYLGGLWVARLASILFIILSIPLFYWIVNDQTAFFYGVYFFALLSTLTTACTPGLLVDLLRPATRSTIFSFSFNLSYGILGGIVPLIGFFLIAQFNNLMAPIYYLVFSAIITLTTTFHLKKGPPYAH